MHIHILGICGTFMGGIAQLARACGHEVTGCDANVYPPMSTQLEAAGINLIEGFDEDQLQLAPDLWIIGNTMRRGIPLLEAILDRGQPYISGPQWLAEHVLNGRWVLAVAGTHGKTTTTSMLAWILEDACLAPGFLVGGVPENFGISARLHGALADSPFFVIEADEYDTAFCDKRSKFVHYRPRTAILNNLEYDHADIFPNLGAIETQFHHLVRTVPRSGLIIANGREESLSRVLQQGCWTPVEKFNTPDGSGWSADGDDATGRFTISNNNEIVGEITWPQSGNHNRANALAALLAARHVGVSIEHGMASLTRFKGVKRRMEIRGTVRGITVYDDFAHHPTAIDTTLNGLRHRIGNTSRILAVLEPRSNTMKLGTMKDQLPHALREADKVYCYTSNLDWDVAGALAPLGDVARTSNNLDELLAMIIAEAKTGDHILIMSNGGFGGIHDKLLKQLKC